MAYKKPQNPLTNNGFGIYPLTTADQVILSDGSRLEKNGAVNLVTLPTTEETPGEAPSINASTFGGMTVSQFVEMIYPVGSIYISASATSPETLFGGTWAQINGRFLIGTGTPENNDDGASPGSYNFAAGSTGGEAKHTLTNDEIPAHNHEASILYNQSGYGHTSKPWEIYITATSGDGWSSTTGTAGTLTNVNTRKLRNVSKTGGGAAHNNMPPYLAVYMWQRTA